eukprot:366219-Chlamydomonas_euryale.AAC.3
MRTCTQLPDAVRAYYVGPAARQRGADLAGASEEHHGLANSWSPGPHMPPRNPLYADVPARVGSPSRARPPDLSTELLEGGYQSTDVASTRARACSARLSPLRTSARPGCTAARECDVRAVRLASSARGVHGSGGNGV